MLAEDMSARWFYIKLASKWAKIVLFVRRFGLIVSSNNPFRPPPNDGLKLKQPRLALPTTTPKVAFNGFGDFTRSVIDSEEAKILRDPGVELEAALVFPKPSIGPNVSAWFYGVVGL